jgi:hypothetical protein
MPEPTSPAAPAVLVSFVLSPEPAFVETAGALVSRSCEQCGCPAAEAGRLGEAVRRALLALIEHWPADRERPLLEVACQSRDRLVSVEVGCTLPVEPGPGPVEAAMPAGPEAAAVRALVDRLEFDRDGARQFWRLTQQIRPPR